MSPGRRLSIHSALWVANWGENLAPHIEKAAELGYDGVELSLLGLASRDADRLRALALDAGISLKCTTGLTSEEDITSSEWAVRMRGRDTLLRAADTVAALGSNLLTGVTYAPWGSFGALGDKQGRWMRSAEILADVAERFAARHITIGVEAINRFETDLINTASEAVQFVDYIASANVGVHLDVFHMNIEEVDIPAAIERAGHRLVHVHISGTDRGIPRPGRVPWEGIFSMLRSIGYRGWIGAEMFVTPERAVSSDLRIWRKIELSAGNAAAAALDFVTKYAQDR